MDDRESKGVLEILAWLISSISFGIWQGSFFAGLFVAGCLVILAHDDN